MPYVYKDRRGKVPRWAIAYKGVDGRLHRERLNVPTKELAKQMLSRRITDVTRAEIAGVRQVNPITFHEFVGEYMVHAKAVKTPHSARRDESSLTHLHPVFGSYRLSDISAGMVQRYVDARCQEKSKSGKVPMPATINRELTCLSAIFREAIKRQYVESSPVKLVRKLPEENTVVRFLSDDEEARLMEFCPSHLRPVIVTALHTGLRRGELFNLTWADVDFENKVVRVQNTKTHRTRYVPMNRVVEQPLKQQPRSINSAYVFASPTTGERWKEIKQAWGTILKRAGIRGFRFHDLRHTFASRLAQRGASIRVIQELLGHGDISTTMRYAHLAPSDLQHAVELLASRGVPATVYPKTTTQITTHVVS